jgi:hypothetical protein
MILGAPHTRPRRARDLRRGAGARLALAAAMLVTARALDTGPALAAPPPYAEAPVPEATAPRYTVLPGVVLSRAVESKLARVSDTYYRRTRKPFLVTSGTRSASQQAEAMFAVLSQGGDVIALYRQKGAAREVKAAYDAGRRVGERAEAILARMTSVIRAQTARGVFLSAHLRESAFDVRSRDMTNTEKRIFLESVLAAGGASVMAEATPPHFHVEFE